MPDESHEDKEKLLTLLTWLSADRDQAWEKYQAIWDRVIKIFVWSRYRNAEDLALEVFRRVEGKMPGLKDTYIGDDPARYFYGVARVLKLEIRREPEKFAEFLEESDHGRVTYAVDQDAVDVYDRKLDHLDYSLQQLSDDDRELILAYYQFGRETKLEDRRRLAEELGLSANALCIRVSRIRSLLRKCVRARSDQDDQAQ
jgi:DNA-directed RNA polymerase specialized sigma24 family protein